MILFWGYIKMVFHAATTFHCLMSARELKQDINQRFYIGKTNKLYCYDCDYVAWERLK